MKKFLALGLFLAVAMASLSFACGDEKTSGTTASASCTGQKAGELTAATGTDAKMVNDKVACTGSMANCTGSGACCDGMAMANYIKETNYKGKLAVVNMSVKGMTCDHCASSVTASLAKVDGVLKVLTVDYKNGLAKVLVASDKVKNDNLIKAVTDKSFEAKLILADAKVKDAVDTKATETTNAAH